MSTPTAKAGTLAPLKRRSTVILLALVVAAAGLIFAGQTWIQITPAGQIVQTEQINVSGSEATNLVTAFSVVALAAAAALSLAGKWAARVIGGLIIVAGAVNIGSTLTVLADPQNAATPVVGEATGVRVVAGDYVLTTQPMLTIICSALLVLVGVLVLVSHRHWKRSRKYDSSATAQTQPGGSRGHLDEIDAWDSLSAEEDPTLR